MGDFSIRFAAREDIPTILGFIRALAAYEKMEDQVIADETLLETWIFEKRKAEVLLAFEGDTPVGFALFFHNFSTWLGRAGIYLEDLFVLPEYRGRGYGKLLLKRLARIAVQRGCGRLEWACLDWNEPSIAFYKSVGARRVDDVPRDGRRAARAGFAHLSIAVPCVAGRCGEKRAAQGYAPRGRTWPFEERRRNPICMYWLSWICRTTL